MRAAMERREAPGLLARARAPRDPHCPRRLGSRKLGVWPGLANPAKEVSQTSWAPPGAPFLSYGRGTENRETGAAGRPKNKTPARRSVGYLEIEAEMKARNEITSTGSATSAVMPALVAGIHVLAR